MPRGIGRGRTPIIWQPRWKLRMGDFVRTHPVHTIVALQYAAMHAERRGEPIPVGMRYGHQFIKALCGVDESIKAAHHRYRVYVDFLTLSGCDDKRHERLPLVIQVMAAALYPGGPYSVPHMDKYVQQFNNQRLETVPRVINFATPTLLVWGVGGTARGTWEHVLGHNPGHPRGYHPVLSAVADGVESDPGNTEDHTPPAQPTMVMRHGKCPYERQGWWRRAITRSMNVGPDVAVGVTNHNVSGRCEGPPGHGLTAPPSVQLSGLRGECTRGARRTATPPIGISLLRQSTVAANGLSSPPPTSAGLGDTSRNGPSSHHSGISTHTKGRFYELLQAQGTHVHPQPPFG